MKRISLLFAALFVLFLGNAALAKEAQADKRAAWPDLDVKVGGQLQLWAVPFDQNDFEQNDPIVKGDPNLDEGFSVRRARVLVNGKLNEAIRFGLMMSYDAAYTGDEDAPLYPELSEAYLDFHRDGLPHLRLGVNKVPYSGQYMNSSRHLLFVQRSVPAEVLGFGRDVGLRIYDAYTPERGDGFTIRRFGWYGGIYNGSGSIFRDDNGLADVPENTDAFANPFGTVNSARVELDLGTAPGPAGESNIGGRTWQDVTLRVGLNAAANRQLEARVVGWGGDLGLFAGPFSLQLEYLAQTTVPLFTDEGIPQVLSEYMSSGWFAQLAFAVVPDRLQFAGRYESYDGNSNFIDADDLQMYTVGVNYYPSKSDALKLQLNYVRRVEASDEISVDNDSVYLALATYF